MNESIPKLDSLDLVELSMTLEEAGLLEPQVDRLAPFLVAPLHVKCIRNGIEVDATVIARSTAAVVFLEDGREGLGVGVLDQDNTIRQFERYRSPEMAVQAFQRTVDKKVFNTACTRPPQKRGGG